MKLLTIAHKKPECIGCGLCAEVAPNYWQMDENGEARLISVRHQSGPFHYGDGFPEDAQVLQEAETGCPVDIIRIQ